MSLNRHSKNQYLTFQRALSGKVNSKELGEKGQEAVTRAPGLAGQLRSTQNRDIFELFITYLGGNTDVSHIGTWLLLLTVFLIQQKQSSGTVYPREHLTPAPGATIKGVHYAHGNAWSV